MESIDVKTGLATAQNFFDEWPIYDEILACNGMHHDELYRAVGGFLADRFGKRSFSFLDLGCGSARHLAAELKDLAVTRYVGYDLSDVALGHAARNLSSLDCRWELHQGDLLEGLLSRRDDFDVIFTGFALHHLSAGAKAQFFRAAGAPLDPTGVLLVIDTFRDDGESRELYLERYCAWLRSRCATLAAQDLDLVCTHIRTCDFPESSEELDDMAAGAGFYRSDQISRFGWHHSFCYRLR